MPRLRATVGALRDLLERESKLPTHQKTYADIEKLLRRANVPEDVRWQYGRPNIPTPNEAIFNFADIGEFPHGYLQEFDQPIALRGVSDTMRPSLYKQPLNAALEAAKQGAKEGSWAWYDMGPYHRFVQEEMDPADAEAAQRLLKLGVPLSQQTSVPAEILGSAALNKMVREGGIDALRGDEAVGAITPFGGGASPNEKIALARRMLQGEPVPPTASKLSAYDQNRAGNLYPATIDSKMLAMLDANPKMGPSQKGVIGAALKAMAARTGTMPAKLQAMMWPEGEKVGVGAQEPLAALINNLVFRSAVKQGINPKQHMIDVLSGREAIPFTQKELGYAAGGIVKKAKGALNALADRMAERLVVPSMSQWAKLDNTNAMLMDNEYALKAYAARQAPLGWESAIMKGRMPELEGSGRKVIFTGVPGDATKHAALKVAQLPRAIRENVAEGEPMLANLDMVPRAFWKSELDDIAAVEKMRTPQSMLKEHEKFMDPMARRFWDVVLHSYVSPSQAHQIDPKLRNMMEERGMSPFLNYDLLGADFFDYKGFQRSPEDYPSRRIQSVLKPKERGGGFMLLDTGALIPDLVRKESDMFPEFRNVLEHRINTLVEPETAEMFGFIPKDLQHKAGFREGGSLGRARKLMAGGGVVRNWLRGVKGSRIDKALEGLKGHRALRTPVREDALRAMAETDPDAKKQLAMRDWIDKNVGNYIVRQMGAEGDPLEELLGGQTRMMTKKVPAADALTHLGREVPSIWERDVNPMKSIEEWRGDERIPPWLFKLIEQDAPRAWSDKQYSKMRTSMPHRTATVMEEETGTARYGDRAGTPMWGEEATKKYAEEKARQYALHEDKYQRRHAAPIELYDIDENAWEARMLPKLRDVLDWLSQSNIPPERMSRVSLPQAIRSSDEWHAALAKKKSEMLGDPWLGTKVHKEYPSGYRWAEFDPASGEALEPALKREGEAMGHCVGDYCENVKSGGTRILSLRDPKGNPHVTVEAQTRRPDHRFAEEMRRERGGEEAWRSYQAKGDGDFYDFVIKEYPHLREKAESLMQSPSITQIKGKANQKPAEDYLPYVQDFVRSGKWAPEIGDYANTGFYNWKQFFPEGAGGSFDDAGLPLYKKWRKNFGPFEEQSYDTIKPLLEQRQHVTQSELEEMLKEAGKASPFKPAGFAQGGSVEKEDIMDLATNMNEWFKGAESAYELPVGMIRSMARAESNFDPRAVSPKGAIGVMQWMPDSAKNPGFKMQGFTPGKDMRTDIYRAAEYMRNLHNKYGDWTKALAAYNWGMGNVNTFGMHKMPPETKRYLQSVMQEVGVNNEFAGPRGKAQSEPMQSASDEDVNEILKLFPDLRAEDEDGEDQALAYLSELLNDGVRVSQPEMEGL